MEDGVKRWNGNTFDPEGQKYIGQWKNDLKHGNGKLYDKNGLLVKKGNELRK